MTAIRVEVGPLSGVEPLLLATAFDRTIPGTSAAGAKLVIDEVALQAECLNCGAQFVVEKFIFQCPDCGSTVRVIRGDELQLVSISFREAETLREPQP